MDAKPTRRDTEDGTVKIKWQDLIEERKEVMAGKPLFKGTRLTVEFVLKQLGAGMSHQELLDQYPTLKPEHIRSASEIQQRIGDVG